MNMMKRTIAFITMILLLASCQMDDFDGKVSRRAARPEAETFGCAMETPWTAATKSQYIAGGFDDEKITNITVAVYDHTSGDLYSKYNFTSGFSSMSITLIPGNAYDLYAVANMGDQRTEVPSTSGAMASFTYTIPSYSDVNTRGLPMSATITNYVAGTSTGNVFNLKRLFAKVTLNVTTSYDGGTSGGVKVMNLKVGNGNAKLTPFGYSALTQAADRLTTEDYQANNSVNASSVVFYVPENMKGNIGSASTSRGKNPDVTPAIAAVSDLLTYVDVAVMANSSYYNGSVHYRSYVGTNATNNFDVRGNYEYTWNMTLTEDGLVNDDWKIDQEMDDLRYISFNQNPVLVEKDEEVRWANLLVTNMAWGDISKNYTGTSIYSATPTSTGFTVKSSASAGNTMTATFTAAHNPKPSLTATTDFIVITRSIAFDDDVYVVNPRGSIGSEVIYSNSYQGRQKGKGSFSQGGGEEWVIVPPAALPHTTTASTNKLDYSYDPVTDIITWTPTRYAPPGDYTIKARKTVGAAGEATATLRVNDTRWINADLAYDSRPRETSIGMASITASSVWNIGYAWGDLSVSDSDNQTVDSPNYGIFAGNDVTANWSDYIGYDFIDGSGQYLTLSGTPTANGMTFSISQSILMGDYSVKVYWKDTWDDGLGDYRIKDNAVLHITGVPAASLSMNPTSIKVALGGKIMLQSNITPNNVTIKDVRWECETDNGVVTLEPQSSNTTTKRCFVHGVTVGTVRVRAVAIDGSGKVSPWCTVTVVDLPVSLQMSPASSEIFIGETLPYTLTAVYASGRMEDVTSVQYTGSNVTPPYKIWPSNSGDVSNTGYLTYNKADIPSVTGKTAGNVRFGAAYVFDTQGVSYYSDNYGGSNQQYTNNRSMLQGYANVRVKALPANLVSFDCDIPQPLYVIHNSSRNSFANQLLIGGTYDLSDFGVTLHYSDNTTVEGTIGSFNATLSSSNSNVFQISGRSGYTGQKGTATLTITISGVSITRTVRVSEIYVNQLKQINDNNSSSFSSSSISCTFTPYNASSATSYDAGWYSTDPSFITIHGTNSSASPQVDHGSTVWLYGHKSNVDANARIYYIYQGQYYNYESSYSEYIVRQIHPGSGTNYTHELEVVPGTVYVNAPGGTMQVRVYYKTYSGADLISTEDVTESASYTMNNSSIASVSSTGLVTGVQGGTTYMSVSKYGKTKRVNVNVTQLPITYARTLTIDPASSTVNLGGTKQLRAYLNTKTYVNGVLTNEDDTEVTTNSGCSWSVVSGGSYASVNNASSKGLVTGNNGPGDALVMATYTTGNSSVNATANIHVADGGTLIIDFND